MNKPKSIGTWTETSTVNLLHSRGFTKAHRRELNGQSDVGDIDVTPGKSFLMIEVKGGKAAEKASRQQIEAWLARTEEERENGGFFYAFLVTKRSGYGNKRTDQWFAHVYLHDLILMLSTDTWDPIFAVRRDLTVTMLLGELVDAIIEANPEWVPA